MLARNGILQCSFGIPSSWSESQACCSHAAMIAIDPRRLHFRIVDQQRGWRSGKDFLVCRKHSMATIRTDAGCRFDVGWHSFERYTLLRHKSICMRKLLLGFWRGSLSAHHEIATVKVLSFPRDRTGAHISVRIRSTSRSAWKHHFDDARLICGLSKGKLPIELIAKETFILLNAISSSQFPSPIQAILHTFLLG